ncbi:MAG: hypothetical protein P1P88_13920 [Bacteroidales bacterium]|nr:hypothetical protein [Bacteroidales bacterium]
MNYIRHLTAFFEKAISDNRLFPTHVSLYMALFQFWNLNHFKNPVSICRSEVLQLSKIGSYNTYHKCLHDLHNFGYIKYEPSHNQFIGSLVHLYNFDTSSVQALRQPCRNNDTTSVQALRHSKNNINILNNKTYIDEKSQKNETVESILKNEEAEKRKRKKVASKKENKMTIPSLDEVIVFFRSENYTEFEAQKFFNHYESNGWKIGSKTPMKDWKAAARNWILNIPKFNPGAKKEKYNPTDLNNKKNYSEPL